MNRRIVGWLLCTGLCPAAVFAYSHMRAAYWSQGAAVPSRTFPLDHWSLTLNSRGSWSVSGFTAQELTWPVDTEQLQVRLMVWKDDEQHGRDFFGLVRVRRLERLASYVEFVLKGVGPLTLRDPDGTLCVIGTQQPYWFVPD